MRSEITTRPRSTQVSYNISGWLEKNKDPLNDSVVDQYKKGTNKLLVEIFADHPGQSGGGADAKGNISFFFLFPRRSQYILWDFLATFQFAVFFEETLCSACIPDEN